MSGRQARETISLAHTARCKLQIAADRPDRNLRFILGHAFTLDKIRLAIAEIDSDDEDGEEEQLTAPRERRVSFRGPTPPAGSIERKRSPPPDQFAHLEDTDSEEEDEEIEEEEEEDGGLSLRRFESGSAKPPQMIDDDSSSSDEDEPRSPPPLTDEELKMITGGEGDSELADAYNHVAGCPCHGYTGAPKVEKVWEVPKKPGYQGGRVAVVQVAT